MYATLWLLRDDPVNDEKQDKDKDKCFIINRAPTDTFVYNDNKDFRAIIIEVHISKIYFGTNRKWPIQERWRYPSTRLRP